MRTDLLFFCAAILVLTILVDATPNKNNIINGKILNFRKRVKRWQCDNGFGGNRFGDFAGGSLLGGGSNLFGGGGNLLGGWGGGGGNFGSLADIDPTTLVLLALLGGTGSSQVSPVPVSSSANTEEAKLVPLPPSGIQKTTTTEAPTTKAVEDFMNDEFSFGFKQQQTPIANLPAESEELKKARGHVTPGNRCEEDGECVAHAECVEALRQKYCVCQAGRRPKGGVCV